MSCFRSVCSNERALVIGTKNLSCCSVVLNCSVEEDQVNALSGCLINNCLGSVYRTGSNDVYNQDICALCKSGIDLLVLCGLVVVCVIVLILYSKAVQLRIQCVTNRRDICVRVGVIEYCDVSIGDLNIEQVISEISKDSL